MRKLLCSVVCVCGCLFSIQPQCLAKEAPIDWYPQEYARLDVPDWPEMKMCLDAIRTARVPSDVPVEALQKAQFTIARISKIAWKRDAQDEVCNYLLEFAKELAEQAASASTVPTKESATPKAAIGRKAKVSNPADLAHMAVWSAGKVAVDVPAKPLIELWTLAQGSSLDAFRLLRWSILGVLEDHHADAFVPEIANRIAELKPLSMQEASDIERIRRMHELSQFKNPSQAWEHVWTVTKPDVENEVLSSKYRLKLGGWHALMLKVYPLEPAVAVSIADKTTDPFKKYVFMSTAVCIMDSQVVMGTEIDRDLLNMIESKTRSVLAEIGRAAVPQRIDGYQNYLKENLQDLIANAQKPSQPNTEPSRPPVRTTTPASREIPPPQKPEPITPVLRPVPENPSPSFSRLEDRGEDFSKLDSHEVVRRLAAADGVADQRKAAKVLGDRQMAKTLDLTEEDRWTLRRYIDTRIEWTAAAAGSDRAEANEQLQRLWTLAAPPLIDNLGHESRLVQEAAIKNLSLMRNEDLISKLIARIEASDDPRVHHAGIFALGRMLEKRESLIPGRVSINDEASQALTDRLVVPFLDRWEQTHQDAETKEAITGARRSLKHPLDTRLRPASAPAQNAPVAAVLTPVADPEPNPSLGPVPVQNEKPQASISPPASPPRLPEQKAPSTTPGTTLVIVLVLAALAVAAGFLYWRRR